MKTTRHEEPNVSSGVKFCKDCEYYSGPWRDGWMQMPAGWPLCFAKVSRLDLIYGTNHYESCTTARSTFCGPDATWFRPIDPKPERPTLLKRLFK